VQPEALHHGLVSARLSRGGIRVYCQFRGVLLQLWFGRKVNWLRNSKPSVGGFQLDSLATAASTSKMGYSWRPAKAPIRASVKPTQYILRTGKMCKSLPRVGLLDLHVEGGLIFISPNDKLGCADGPGA
jgi:hypothetical protein